MNHQEKINKPGHDHYQENGFKCGIGQPENNRPNDDECDHSYCNQQKIIHGECPQCKQSPE
jgi:hypothetical protein